MWNVWISHYINIAIVIITGGPDHQCLLLTLNQRLTNDFGELLLLFDTLHWGKPQRSRWTSRRARWMERVPVDQIIRQENAQKSLLWFYFEFCDIFIYFVWRKKRSKPLLRWSIIGSSATYFYMRNLLTTCHRKMYKSGAFGGDLNSGTAFVANA